MRIKFFARGTLWPLLLIALQVNIQYGFAQEITLNNQSFKNNFANEGDTNLNLREAILRIKKTFQVDILFEDALVSSMSVSSDAAWSKSVNAEEALNKLLKDFQLKFRKVKKHTYIIINTANAYPKQDKRITSDKRNANESSQQESTQAINEKSNVSAIIINGVKRIEGRVLSQDGQPLQGVSVTVKGGQTGTSTDDNGNFSLTVDESATTLIFSYVGYESKEVSIANRETVSVVLQAETKGLDDVVVIGYGTQRKVSLTSAVGTIKSDDISRRVVSNTQQVLQGLAPGLTVLDQGGAPGRSTANVRIRGITTLSGNNPLILVDGIEQGFNNLNPDDIESISILKDAAATAIYGSRAAAGVILVSTKRAKDGKLNISYNVYVAMHKIGDHPKHMSTADYMRQQDTAYAHIGQAIPYSDSLINVWTNSSDRIKYPLANDWYNQVFRTAPQYNNNLTISGGNKQFRGLINFRYMRQEGIVANFNNDIKELRLNTDFLPLSKLKFSVDANYRMLYSSSPQDAGGVFFNVLHGAQFVTPRYPDGGYGVSAQGNNPLIHRDLSGYNRNWYIYFAGNLKGEWQILKSLKFSTQYGIVGTGDRDKVFRNKYLVVDQNNPSRTKTVGVNQLTESRGNTYQETINSILEFKTKIEDHNISLLGGYSQFYFRGDNLSASRTGLYNNDIQAISSGDLGSRDNSGSDNESGLRSYFGRFNYDFAGRYFLEANGRYDGSSNFTGANLYSFFPSFSAGWRISQEKFWNSFSGIVSELKLRGSWGKTGNQTIGAYSFYEALSVLNYNFNDQAATGYGLRNYANKDIMWETTTQTDIGLDAGFINNKLNLTFDYYDKRTSDILLNLPIPGTVGLNAPVQNAGVVTNKGWEVLLNYRNHAGKLTYDFSFNLSNNINEVIDLKGTGPYISGSINDALYVTKEGLPIGALWGWKTDGLYKDQKDVDTSAKWDPNSFPGDVKYVDLNKDGKITADDRTKVGDPFPHYTYGFTSNLQYKNFDFYLFLQGAVKQDARISGAFADAGNNQGFVIALQNDFWSATNVNARFPRPQKFSDKNANMSDFWVVSMGYIRVKNLQFGYTLPTSVIGKLKIQRARFYVSGTNIFTISKAKEWGIDPEFPSGRANYYPQTKAYTIGFNINF